MLKSSFRELLIEHSTRIEVNALLRSFCSHDVLTNSARVSIPHSCVHWVSRSRIVSGLRRACRLCSSVPPSAYSSTYRSLDALSFGFRSTFLRADFRAPRSSSIGPTARAGSSKPPSSSARPTSGSRRTQRCVVPDSELFRLQLRRGIVLSDSEEPDVLPSIAFSSYRWLMRRPFRRSFGHMANHATNIAASRPTQSHGEQLEAAHVSITRPCLAFAGSL